MRTVYKGILLLSLFLLCPSAAAAQATFTITAPTASVRTEPRVASPVVRDVTRGTVLKVVATRGEWIVVAVVDPRDAQVHGYVSATLGKLSGDAPVTSLQGSQAVPFGRPMAGAPRLLGLGGHLGGFTFGVGANARFWTSDRVGVQFGFSRFSIGESNDFGGVSASAEIAANQVGALVLVRVGEPDADGDIVLRPYAGGGINLFRTTSKSSASGFGITVSESESETNLGFQVLGGVELGFRNAPRLTVSADLGYYATGTSFGVSLGGFAYGFGVHWYVK